MLSSVTKIKNEILQNYFVYEQVTIQFDARTMKVISQHVHYTTRFLHL